MSPRIPKAEIEFSVTGDKAKITFSWKWLIGIIITVICGLGVASMGGGVAVGKFILTPQVVKEMVEPEVTRQVEPLRAALSVHKHTETEKALVELKTDQRMIRTDVREMRKEQGTLTREVSRVIGRIDTYIAISSGGG